jgi:hypothetical protein
MPKPASTLPGDAGIYFLAVELATTGTIILPLPRLHAICYCTLPDTVDISHVSPAYCKSCPSTFFMMSGSGAPSSPEKK